MKSKLFVMENVNLGR